jgi:hypothetical protein
MAESLPKENWQKTILHNPRRNNPSIKDRVKYRLNDAGPRISTQSCGVKRSHGAVLLYSLRAPLCSLRLGVELLNKVHFNRNAQLQAKHSLRVPLRSLRLRVEKPKNQKGQQRRPFNDKLFWKT